MPVKSAGSCSMLIIYAQSLVKVRSVLDAPHNIHELREQVEIT